MCIENNSISDHFNENKYAVLRSQSRKEPHHFGGFRDGAATRYSSGSDGSGFKLDVKNVTHCNSFLLFPFNFVTI
jgi:hypothetical protein